MTDGLTVRNSEISLGTGAGENFGITAGNGGYSGTTISTYGLTVKSAICNFETGCSVNIKETTDASSTGTGALVVDGGVGIAKNLYVGSKANVNGMNIEKRNQSIIISNNTSSTALETYNNYAVVIGEGCSAKGLDGTLSGDSGTNAGGVAIRIWG